MIRVLCLNPTIDRMYYIDGFRSGRQFHGNRPDVYPSGKGVNVARVLRSLGDSPVLYAFIGGGNGNLVKEEVGSAGIEAVFFHHSGETRSTVNIIDHQRKEETEITEDGVEITKQEQNFFLSKLEDDLLEGDMVICSGLPMNGMDDDIYHKVSLLCERKKAQCSLDANRKYLRSSFPGRYVFAKPNRSELSSLFGYPDNQGEETIIELAGKLADSGVDNVLVSEGDRGACFVSSSRCYRVSIPAVEAISTIGCGDSSVAGFCHALYHGSSVEDAIRCSMACGIANTLTEKVGTVNLSDVQNFISSVRLDPL